jgi:hypothetical protein
VRLNLLFRTDAVASNEKAGIWRANDRIIQTKQSARFCTTVIQEEGRKSSANKLLLLTWLIPAATATPTSMMLSTTTTKTDESYCNIVERVRSVISFSVAFGVRNLNLNFKCTFFNNKFETAIYLLHGRISDDEDLTMATITIPR